MNNLPDVLDDSSLQRGAPECDHITITPKHKPQLKHFLKSWSWNCAEQSVSLRIAETPAFSTFGWLNNINACRARAMRSPFGDLEQDLLLLEFRDIDDVLVAKVTLNGLELLQHRCKAGRDKPQPLFHEAIIRYEKLILEVQAPECKTPGSVAQP